MAISLSSLRRSTPKPPRIVIYGVQGIGKTEFASLAPRPVFLCAEDGLGKIQADAWDVRSYQDVLSAITVLHQEAHDFSTVVIDTADSLEPLIWAHVCETVPHEKGKPIHSIEDYGYGKGYTHAMGPWRTILEGLTALRDARGMAVVVCAHSKIQTVKSPDSDDYEKYALKLNDKAEGLIRGWCDCLLFANYETRVISSGRDGSDRHRAVGTGKRILYTQERPAFHAKNRYSLPAELPFDKGTSWQTFVEAMEKGFATASAPSPGVPAPAQ